MVGGEVSSGGVHHHSRIILVRQSGGNAVVCFRMPYQTKGEAYSVGGSGGGGGGGKKGSWCKF